LHGVPVLLEAGALTIRRGRRTVLSGVALTVDPGRAIHVAGPNGSGKTSLLRVLAGLAAPRAGTLRRHAACAFVPERVRLAPAVRCGEWLRAMRALRGLTGTDWHAAADASGLDPAVLDRPAATLSRGMLQRVALLEALDAGCPLLLLDEPFSGLDDDGRAWLAGQVTERLDAGAAVLLTDHSGAATGHVALTDVVRLGDGTAHHAAAVRTPARRLAARAAPTALEAPAVTVRAAHPDGRRLERVVAAGASDDLLRALLDAGWHVDEVRP
jgi:ABC-type multidrug transport system ATPase subunit